MRYSKLNGQLVPAERVKEFTNSFSVAPDPGLLETMLVLDGVIQLKDYHWQRLLQGAVLMDIPAIDNIRLEQEISELIRKNNSEAVCKVRLQVYPDRKHELSRCAIEAITIPPELIEYNRKGLVTGIAEDIAKVTDATANLKTTDRRIYDAASDYAAVCQWDEALIRNDIGRISETSISNIFWVKDNVVFTPPLSEGCVAGTMRRFLLAELPKSGYKVEEHPLTEATLYDADEVFFSNAIRRIKWVGQAYDRNYCNSLSSEIASLLFP